MEWREYFHSHRRVLSNFNLYVNGQFVVVNCFQISIFAVEKHREIRDIRDNKRAKRAKKPQNATSDYKYFS